MCLEIMTGFTPTDEANTFDDGQVYSTYTEKTYNGSMTLRDQNHLRLTGSVLLGLISRTTTWTRVKNPGKDPCQ